MITVCPQCGDTLTDTSICSKCGDTHYSKSRLSEPVAEHKQGGDRWAQTPTGRIFVGVLLALTLCYGLLQFCMACLRALGHDAASGALSPLTGLLLFHGLQGVALLGGGILAGIGQRRGVAAGAVVGVLSGVVFIGGMTSGLVSALLDSFAHELLTPGTNLRQVTLFSLPLLHAFFGALGGVIGGKIWHPPADIGLEQFRPAYAGARKSIYERLGGRRSATAKSMHYWSGPVSWVRILAGIMVAVAGAIWTRSIIDFVILLADGKLELMTQLDDQIAFGEVFSLSILIGGCIAGSNTFNGLKQGICMGIGAAIMMVGIFSNNPSHHFVSALFPVLSTLLLGPIGGWIGSELLPPTYRRKRRKRLLWA